MVTSTGFLPVLRPRRVSTSGGKKISLPRKECLPLQMLWRTQAETQLDVGLWAIVHRAGAVLHEIAGMGEGREALTRLSMHARQRRKKPKNCREQGNRALVIVL